MERPAALSAVSLIKNRLPWFVEKHPTLQTASNNQLNLALLSTHCRLGWPRSQNINKQLHKGK